LPACSTGTPHAEPYDLPQLICCQSRNVTCHLVLVVSVQLLIPSGVVSQLTSVLCNSLNIPTAFKITPLSVQFLHCLATHLSASDSLRAWRYTNLLLTYLLTALVDPTWDLPVCLSSMFHELGHSAVTGVTSSLLLLCGLWNSLPVDLCSSDISPDISMDIFKDKQKMFLFRTV